MITLFFSETKLFSRSTIGFSIISKLLSEFRSFVPTWIMICSGSSSLVHVFHASHFPPRKFFTYAFFWCSNLANSSHPLACLTILSSRIIIFFLFDLSFTATCFLLSFLVPLFLLLSLLLNLSGLLSPGQLLLALEFSFSLSTLNCYYLHYYFLMNLIL